jgi:protein gp37
MNKTKIEWTDYTWNPWQGCHKVSPGCDNCYMHRDKKRYGQDPTVVVRSSLKTFNLPDRLPVGSKVFPCSWSDFFIKEADPWRDEAWDIIRRNPNKIFQIPTKRVERIPRCLPKDWGKGWPHVWLGASIENQEMADLRISLLLQIQAAVRFVSLEPMLSEVNLKRVQWPGKHRVDVLRGGTWELVSGFVPKGQPDFINHSDMNRIDWVICGGESGPNARPMHPDWVRSLRDQCVEAGTAFFFKQWGEWAPFTQLEWVDD